MALPSSKSWSSSSVSRVERVLYPAIVMTVPFAARFLRAALKEFISPYPAASTPMTASSETEIKPASPPAVPKRRMPSQVISSKVKVYTSN